MRWIVVAVVVALALFAIVVGGFLWPRDQFRRGPWADEERAPAPADTSVP